MMILSKIVMNMIHKNKDLILCASLSWISMFFSISRTTCLLAYRKIYFFIRFFNALKII
jgi:hypothetical protein